MNLVIAIVIVLCLVTCEFSSPEPVQDVWTHVWAMMITALIVPGLAAFQTFVVTRRIRTFEMDYETCQTIIKRLSIAHSAVWLAASLAIVCATEWQNVVRDNWQLDRWPLIDEAVIVMPILLSLVASWAIFFEIHRTFHARSSPATANSTDKAQTASRAVRFFTRLVDSKRLRYVSIRFRVYCGLVLIPVGVMVFIRDLQIPWDSLNGMQSVATLVLLLLTMLAISPFLLMMVWRNSQIPDTELRQTLAEDCQTHRLRIFGLRVWKTNGQVLNAMVAGVIPWLRVILISDKLVKQFSQHEIRAVLRHEAGHIRQRHVLIRMGFVALPLLMLVSFEFSSLKLLSQIQSIGSVNWPTIGGVIAIVCAALVIVAYFATVLPWLSRRMEHEADLYASAIDQRIEPTQLTGMIDALIRFAAHAPEQLNRRSWMHPSLQQRIDVLTYAASNPETFVEFRRSFRHQQAVVAIVGGLVALLPVFM